jgi:hypothetical protein
MGDVVNLVINHTPPTFWNQVPMFAASSANQIARNTAIYSGAHTDGATSLLVAIGALHKLSRYQKYIMSLFQMHATERQMKSLRVMRKASVKKMKLPRVSAVNQPSEALKPKEAYLWHILASKIPDFS